MPDFPNYANPTNKLMMPAEAMAPAIGVAQGLQNLQTTKFDLAQKHMDLSLRLLGSLASNPNATMDDVTRVSQMMSEAGLPAHSIATGIQEFAKDPSPAGIHNTSVSAIARLAGVAQQQQMGGAAPPQLFDNGQTAVPVTVRGGHSPAIYPAGGNPMQKYMSPEGAASPVTGPPTVAGAPTTIPLGNYAERAGTVKPGTYTRPAAPMATGLPPGVAEAKKITGGAGGTSLAAARDNNANYQQQVYPLEQAIPALERLGKTGSGPGTDEFNHFKSFMQSMGVPGLDANKIKDFDEAKKLLVQWVNQNGNSGTNDKLAAAFSGNPSMTMSNAASLEVAKSALALRKMQAAQLDAFEKSGLPESEHGAFTSKWNRNNDPRVYGFDNMTPTQRKTVLQSLPEAKRQMFMFSVQQAAEDGLIKAPR